MKADDPRLEKGLKDYVERSNKLDALRLAVIKGHLFVEQAIDEFLAATVFHPEFLREGNFRFVQKAMLCQSLALNEKDDNMWALLFRANTLRNMVAHGKIGNDFNSTVAAVRALYAKALGPERAKEVSTQLDDKAVEDAFLFCAGVLAALTEDAKARRNIIDKYWKPAQ